MMAKTSGEWQRPNGVTLKEMVVALAWFGVDVSFDALRQAVRALDVPAEKGRGPGGRGNTAYYDFSVLWMLATAYQRVVAPKEKFQRIASEIRLSYQVVGEPFTIAHMFNDEPDDDTYAAPEVMHEAYLAYVTHLENGLDLRVLDKVARTRWSEVGLDDDRLAGKLRHYKRLVLQRLGVPWEVASTVGLTGDVPISGSPEGGGA